MLTFTYRYRKQIFASLVIGIALIALIFVLFLSFKTYTKDEVKVKRKKEDKKTTNIIKTKKEREDKNIDEVSVDIKGAVLSPGIYSLDSNSRIIDVINLAGGLLEYADTSVINLSRKIKDEMVIIIYTKNQVNNFKEVIKEKETVVEKCIENDSTTLKNDACITKEDLTNQEVNNNSSNDTNISGKTNINTASIEDLTKLNGIGESRAKDIIKYREQNPFKTIEDIKEVKGIGDSLFDKIKENITV